MPTAYVSEATYSGSFSTDFIEVAITSGTDVSGWTVQVYDSSGQWFSSMNFPAVTATVAGEDVYLFEQGAPSWPNLNSSHSIAIVDDTGSVLQFLSFQDPPTTATDGDAAGSTPTYVGTTINSGESLQSDDGGSSYFVQTTTNPGTIPCFAPGMMVDCPGGARPVEALFSGDLVLTRDSGEQPVVWTDCREEVFTRADFSDRPVLIAAQRFGANCDLIVSPQHRILIQAGSGVEVLVPAKALLGYPGIRQMRGRKRMTWHHFALGSHEVVRVNSTWTESLLLGPMVLNALPRSERQRLRGLFPRIRNGALNGPSARPCLKMREAREVLAANAAANYRCPPDSDRRDFGGGVAIPP